MDDFGKYCYLDVQKTGSTFIGKFLRECSIRPSLMSKKHATVQHGFNRNHKGNFSQAGCYRQNTYYFNSVRNPLNYYVSLYNFGCDGRGGLYLSLRRIGKDDFYTGSVAHFYAWMDFLLDEQKLSLIDQGYHHVSKTRLGLLSYRFILLSMASPIQKLALANNLDEALALFEAENIAAFTIRTEHMIEDLSKLVFDELSGEFDIAKVTPRLSGERINGSKSNAIGVSDLRKYPNLELLLEKDKLIFDRFYSNTLPSK